MKTTKTPSLYKAAKQVIEYGIADHCDGLVTVPAELMSQLEAAHLARNDGAEYPVFGDSSDGEPVIVDTGSGRTWKIELREF